LTNEQRAKALKTALDTYINWLKNPNSTVKYGNAYTGSTANLKKDEALKWFERVSAAISKASLESDLTPAQIRNIEESIILMAAAVSEESTPNAILQNENLNSIEQELQILLQAIEDDFRETPLVWGDPFDPMIRESPAFPIPLTRGPSSKTAKSKDRDSKKSAKFWPSTNLQPKRIEADWIYNNLVLRLMGKDMNNDFELTSKEATAIFDNNFRMDVVETFGKNIKQEDGTRTYTDEYVKQSVEDLRNRIVKQRDLNNSVLKAFGKTVDPQKRGGLYKAMYPDGPKEMQGDWPFPLEPFKETQKTNDMGTAGRIIGDSMTQPRQSPTEIPSNNLTNWFFGDV